MCKVFVLFDEVGWVVGDDGMCCKDGEVLSVEIFDSLFVFDWIYNFFIENLKCLGVEVVLNCVDFV